MSAKTVSTLYFSPTHGTETVVKAVAQGTGLPQGQDINATRPAARQEKYSFGPEELLVIGMPVYGGRIPGICFDFVGSLQGNKTPVILLAVYGNRDYDHAVLEMHALLAHKGFKTMGAGMFVAPHSFNAEIGAGRPNAEDVAQAQELGHSVVEKIAAGAEALSIFDLMKPQSKGKGVGPVVSDKCVNCGTCAAGCPSGAIDINNFPNIDGSKCIMCCACIRYCPQGAIAFPEAVGLDQRAAFCMNAFGKPDKANKVVL